MKSAYHLGYGTAYVDRVAAVHRRNATSAHHQVHCRQYDCIELTEYPLATPGRPEGPHPDLADVVEHILVQKSLVTHVHLVIWITHRHHALGTLNPSQ